MNGSVCDINWLAFVCFGASILVQDLLNETDETQETNVSTLEADNIEKTPTVSMEVKLIRI